MKMNIRMLVVALSVLATAVPARCAEPAAAEKAAAPAASAPAKGGGLLKWFKNVKTSLEKSAVQGRYRKVRAGAVAAVRGAGQDDVDPKKPYWKGGLSDKKAAEYNKERAEFKVAVDAILKGDFDGGAKKLDEFEAAHPRSKLMSDVKEARAKLAELKAQGGAPEEEASGKEEAQAETQQQDDEGN